MCGVVQAFRGKSRVAAFHLRPARTINVKIGK